MIERIYVGGSDALPSRFQLGDYVRARGHHGFVSGVMFRHGKVFYEVNGVEHSSDEVTEALRLAPHA